MAKYIFIAPYTILAGNISVGQGGATGGTIVKSFNIGDIIEGVKKSQRGGQPSSPLNVYVETVVNSETFPISDFLIKEYTGTGTATSDNKSGNTQFVWTPLKKGLAVALAIGAILGILKLTKVI